ncbi:MAG: hypothetical protein WBB00_01990 [Mycobacterium sp.]
MKLRLVLVFVGVVSLLVGIVGLMVPVSISADRTDVSCGSAVAPDLSEARANDDASAANVPVADGIVTDANATRLCTKDLEDRRLWTIPVAAVGALALLAAGAQTVLSRKRT